jgi:hypothetical protein
VILLFLNKIIEYLKYNKRHGLTNSHFNFELHRTTKITKISHCMDERKRRERVNSVISNKNNNKKYLFIF